MNPHGGQDWVGFAVWMAVLIPAAYFWAVSLRAPVWDKMAQLPAIDELRVLDHVLCAGPECDQTICACWLKAGGTQCVDTVDVGCAHGEGFCPDCRDQCRECRAEDQAQADLDYARGK